MSPIQDFNERYWRALRGANRMGFSWPYEIFPFLSGENDAKADKKLLGARKSFAPFSLVDERPLVLFDNSVFGGGSSGLLLTDRFLYGSADGKTGYRISTDGLNTIKFELNYFSKSQVPRFEAGGKFFFHRKEHDITPAMWVLSDFFGRLRRSEIGTFDPLEVEALLKPGLRNPFLAELQGKAGWNVMLGCLHSKFDDERILVSADDYVITKYRILLLPSRFVMRTADTIMTGRPKPNERPHPIHAPHLHDPIHQVISIVATATFNKWMVKSHNDSPPPDADYLIEFKPLTAFAHVDNLSDLVWKRDQAAALAKFVEDVERAGLPVSFTP